MLAGALQAACKPGLDKVEVQRLQVVATLARTYKDIVGDYVDYHGLEVELQKMRENYEFWQRKTTGVQAKQFFPVIPKNLKKPEECASEDSAFRLEVVEHKKIFVLLLLKSCLLSCQCLRGS